jgi:hypothetical protein
MSHLTVLADERIASSVIGRGLARWISEVKTQILILPKLVSKVSRLSLHAKQSLLGVFSEFMKRTQTYRRDAHFSSLWNFLSADQQLAAFISEIPFVKVHIWLSSLTL